MGRIAKYTAAQIAEVKELKSEGYMIKEIAILTNIPKGTVGNMLASAYYEDRTHGIVVKQRKEVKREHNPMKAVLIHFCNGLEYDQIACTTKLPISIVQTLIEDAIKLGKLKQTWTIAE